MKPPQILLRTNSHFTVHLILYCFLCTSPAYGQPTDTSVTVESAPGGSVSGAMLSKYQPTADGFRIVGSQEVFNRALYGGHAQDDLKNKYYTLAGDQPLILGATVQTVGGGNSAKCGTLMLGFSQSHGTDAPNKYGSPAYGVWFHQCRDNVATFRDGWCEYQLKPLTITAPEVKATLEILPLQEVDGFVAHLRMRAESQVDFCAAFGGVTDNLGLITNPGNRARDYSPDNCRGNVVTCGQNRALVTGPHSKMWIGTTFISATCTTGDAAKIQRGPSEVMAPAAGTPALPIARLSCPIPAGEEIDGVIVVVRNQSEETLDKLLGRPALVDDLKRELTAKHQALVVKTPDAMFDLTVPANVLGMDGCWDKEVFCHGAVNWHSPYLGWRICYGATNLGWHDRVVNHFRTHAAPSRFYVDPQHGDGYISPDLNGRGFGYNMQEVGIDMLLHNLEWTGDLDVARETFDRLDQALRWEARTFDPDGNGLYQSFLNTWISDGHAYNGGECTQASAYNYRANRVMARIAEKLGRDSHPFTARADKIRSAVQKELWLADPGVFAEFRDTIGNRLIHPSPELATIYHAIECDLADPLQGYQALRFTETEVRNERTLPRQGRLTWSSNWYPRSFSTCGLYPQESIHLAWAYFRAGQTEAAHDILRGIVDAHFMGFVPGAIGHLMNGTGASDGSPDFADIVSMYLRLVVEGVFGIQLHLLDGRIDIAPGFPLDWDQAQMKTRELALDYHRQDRSERLIFTCDRAARRVMRLPMRGRSVSSVSLNGAPAKYRIEPGIGRSDIVVESEQAGELTLRIEHGPGTPPSQDYPRELTASDGLKLTVSRGEVLECRDPSGAAAKLRVDGKLVRGVAQSRPGWHTIFVRVRDEAWEGWLPADFLITEPAAPALVEAAGTFEPLDISPQFNIELQDVHKRDYASPRPGGLSLMTTRNGRYAWDDNNLAGPRTVKVDDARLRECGGIFTTPRGIPFKTPATGNNAACVSMWDNFPDELVIPLTGQGTEIAVLLFGVTNPLQSRVENGRFTVRYEDQTTEVVKLINPENFDDWLVTPTQRANETVVFSDFNHAIVQRIRLDPAKKVRQLETHGTANEVVVGILGVSIRRP